MDLKRIDVLKNRDTGEEFHEDDIVTITTKGAYGRSYTGRIHWIETLELTLDMSEKHKHKTMEIKYEDIMKIEYAQIQ
jgi:hypothetical protein